MVSLLLICEEGLNSTVLARTLSTVVNELHVEYSLSAYYWGSEFLQPDVVAIMFSLRLMREHFVLQEMEICPELSNVPVVAMALHPNRDELKSIMTTYGVNTVYVFPFSLRDLTAGIQAACS